MLESLRNFLRRQPAATPDAVQAPIPHDDAQARRSQAAWRAAQGNQLVASGHYEQAVDSYEQALRLEPDHVQACANLGFALLQLDRLPEAQAWLDKALGLDPQREEPYLFLAQIAERQGDLEQARQRLHQAVQCKPDFAYAWQELCRLQFHAGLREQARASALRGLQHQPEGAMLHFYLGNLLLEENDPAGAIEHYLQALRGDSDWPELHLNIAQALIKRNDPEAALRSLERAIALDPEAHEPYVQQALAWQRMTRFDAAEQAFRNALQRAPDALDALYGCGELLMQRGRFDEAEECLERAFRGDPDELQALVVRGRLLAARGCGELSEAAYREALALRPDDHNALNNLGALLMDLQRFEEAEAAFRSAIRAEPGNVAAAFNLGLLLLRLGRLIEGWPLFEARNDPRLPQPAAAVPALPFPQWRGEPLEGRSILVLPEQGYGDEIQMARYLPLLRQRGAARVSLVCKPPLEDLLRGCGLADTVYRESQTLDLHDYWVFNCSLPGCFGTALEAVPAHLPYLAADPARIAAWAPRLPAGARRVGLVWKGAAAHNNDLHRSLPGLGVLEPLWSCPGLQFVSLQKGQGEEEAALHAQAQPLAELGSQIASFADTAAILAQIDLLICVDTSTAHLAGALGRPCWVLLPHVGCDWRWLLDREDSPWYPGVMRLFRQQPGQGWDEVVARVAAALRDWAAG